MAALPPLPAILKSAIEIFGPAPGAVRWGGATAVWGTSLWVTFDWQDVTPQSMNARVSWGADTVQGVLSIPAAGDWSIVTYDPERLLDPSNNESPFSSALHPGNPVRLRFMASNPALSRVVRQGKIDTISFNVSSLQGKMRATDGVAGLVAARIPKATPGAPTTLRAMARWAIAKAGLSTVVEPDPIDSDTSLPLPDPPIGAGLTDEASVWQWLLTGALDALHAVWMDNNAVLRFRSFGAPRDLGLTLGGEALGGILFDDLDTESSLQGVYSRVVAFDDGAPTTPISNQDIDSFKKFGDNFYQRDRPVADGSFWSTSVLADRAQADLTYRIGTLRPQTEQQFADLLDAGMVDIVHVLVDSVAPPIAIDARLLGAAFEANTTSGWSADVIAYVPGTEWSDAELPPPIEPPTPPATQQVTRNYSVTKDTRASLTSGNAKYGEGTGPTLPIGAWNGWRNRAFVDFTAIPWGDVVSIVSAELRVTTSDQDKVGFGSNPRVTVKRITSAWSEGSASAPSGSNATVYPGPSTTTAGQVVGTYIPASENTLDTIKVLEIVKAWSPAAIGGGGQTQRGVAIFSNAEDNQANTTEFWAREHANSIVLRIVVNIPA